MPKKGKGIRCKYDREDMERAVTAVNTGNLSVRKAAATFNVPRSSLHDRVSGRVDSSAAPGKQPVFPSHVERHLADKIKETAQMGFGVDRQQLKAKAARLAVSLRLKTPFKNGIPGDDWVNGFIKRNGISLRSQVALSTVRSRMLNKTVTEKYFHDLDVTIKALNLQNSPDCIWNMDETSVSLTHKPSRVFAATGSRNVPGRVGNSRESITVTACVNAAGTDVPPMVVVKGKTRKSLNSFNVTEAPFGTKWTYQSKGWMEESLGTEWFTGVFVPNIGPRRPQLLVLDSHSSHETLDLLKCAKAEDITLFALPPHTTQWLNPLDKTIFGPFSKEYNRECTHFMARSPNNLVCKWVWPSLFKSAYEKSFTKHNITKGFSACGIHPTDMGSIPESAFLPSMAFDQHFAATNAEQELSASLPSDVPASLIEGQAASNTEDQDGLVGTVLATADESGTLTLESVSAAEVLEAIMNAGVNFDGTYPVADPEASTLPSTFLPTEAIRTPKEEVACLFHLPKPSNPANNRAKKRAITSHRVLTSEQIMNEKEEAKRRKEDEIRKKEERQLARKAKSLIKEEQKKKVVKRTPKCKTTTSL